MTDKENHISPASEPAGLGAEFKDFMVPPGAKLKNAPADYTHGSVTGQINYWRDRAHAAERRLELRLADIEIEKRETSKLVVLESPFAGDRVRNKAYLHAMALDSLKRGEYPYASHGFFPYFLDDDSPGERLLGIEAGLAWGMRAGKTILCMDLGISRGMQIGLDAAKIAGREVVERSLEGWKK